MSYLVSVNERLKHSAGALEQMLAHARHLQHLNEMLAQFAGDPLSTHCRVANLRADTVVFHAESPVWGARLRYYIPELLAFLKQRCGHPGLIHAQIHIQPNTEATPNSREAPSLSPASSHLLESVAKTTSDTRLKDALLRLSRRTAQNARC